jgi:inward rectifier potassium channel
MAKTHLRQANHQLRALMTRAVTLGKSSIVSLGGYSVTVTGVRTYDLRDPYHLVFALSWPRFILLAVGAYLMMNVAFAGLYLQQSGAVANARPGSFADAFFFSVETAGTVGYGEMYPATLYGHIVCTTEIFAGVAFTALATGLLFVRFSRPRARICYAESAVIASHHDQPTLMIRIANRRNSLLYNAAASLSVLLSSRTEGGEVFRRIHELRLERPRLPMFSLTWTLMHIIDEASPLHGYDKARLSEADAFLWLGIEARDVTLAADVIDTRGYAPEEIQFGMRYAEILSFDGKGHPVADLAAVSRLTPDVGPEPERSGWDDRRLAEAGTQV